VTEASHLDEFRILYGELAALGIKRGEPFAPDERMTAILEDAARIGNAQMRAQSFGDRRPDRVVARPPMGMGGAALRERRLLRHRLPRCRRAREVVLPGDRRLTGYVPALRGRRVALLARAPR
jgi:hypothetical protein